MPWSLFPGGEPRFLFSSLFRAAHPPVAAMGFMRRVASASELHVGSSEEQHENMLVLERVERREIEREEIKERQSGDRQTY